MTTKENWYRRKRPELQFRIIKAIALSGHSSNNKLTRKLKVSHPVISAALNSLKTAKLIEYSHSEVHIHSKGRSEIYYSLTEKGWKEFISEIPIPKEFCVAILNTYRIRAQSGALKPMNKTELDSYFEIYKQKYLGYTSTQGHLVQSPFFNKLYEQWLAEYRQSFYEQSQLKRTTSLIDSPFFEKCYEESLEKYDPNGITVVQKVLECLAIHRSITEKQIYECLKSKHEETKEKLAGKIFRYPDFVREQIEHDYDVTKENISRVIDRYSHVERYIQGLLTPEEIEYNRVTRKYLEFLSHLVVIKKKNEDEPRYELSLFGIMLILAIVSHPQQKMLHVKNIDRGFVTTENDLTSFYKIVSKNYADKLPLIFGKWPIITSIWPHAYKGFLPVLYQNTIDEFTRFVRLGSVSITLGGVKEYIDSMEGIAFHIASKLIEIYQSLRSVRKKYDHTAISDLDQMHNIEHDENTEQDANAAISFLVEKEKELSAFLKYADLANYLMSIDDKKTDQIVDSLYDSDFSVIEEGTGQ